MIPVRKSSLNTKWVKPGLFLLLFVLLFQSLTVFGQVAKYDAVSNSKLHFLKEAIHTDHRQTQLWWYGWLGGYSAATVAQGAIYFASDDKNLKQDMALGAVTTILGAAGQFISPFKPNNEFAQFKLMAEGNDEEKLLKLAAAEKLLSQWSERERLALTWQNHILCTAVNLGGGLITWIGFKRTWKDGLINFAINEVVTEAQIWIQPTYAKRYYKKYCREFQAGMETYSYLPEVNWYIQAKPGGLGIKITF
jgi:hypothetical protein